MGVSNRLGWFSVQLAVLALALPTSVAGASTDGLELTEMSLEALMEIEVTTVSKRAQRLSETPAAVTVLTSEDIRRSGMTSVPEVLRLVPGLHVAQIDGSTWAITARGFNSQFANKLLVMIDGRSVYTPLFSGVYWDVQDVMLEDVERIEVVRGPGGTVWGANAVNGVINIITRDAASTQGFLGSAAGGSLEHGAGSFRFGGALGDDVHYRVYSRYFNRNGLDDPRKGGEAHDAYDAIRGGMRMDWNVTGSDSLTFQGDYYDGEAGETSLDLSESEADVSGGNFLARWTHSFSDGSDFMFQTYYDRTERGGDLLDEDRDTFDVEIKHHFSPLSRNDVVWGLGYRLTADDIRSSGLVAFTPSDRTDHLVSGFLQDEITLIPEQLRATIGTKLEHNDYSGLEVQPSARLLWTPHARHTAWAAVSRAVRAPSRAEDDVSLLVPMAPTLFSLLQGQRSFESEDLLAYEIGYRGRPVDLLTFDIAAYFNEYQNLRSLEPGLPLFNFPAAGLTTLPFSGDNRMDARAYGVELSASVDVTDYWRLIGGYTFMKIDAQVDIDSLDPASEGQQDDTPEHQFQLRSQIDLPWSFELDTAVLLTDDVKNQNVDDYTRFDVRLGWRPWEHWEISVAGQNLLKRRHEEFGPSFTRLPSSVPRSVVARLTWRQ